MFSTSIKQSCFDGVWKHSQLIKEVKQQLVKAGAVASYDNCFYEILERGEAGLIIWILFKVEQKLNGLQQFFQSFDDLVFKFS